ncbi:MAG: hypothetical protein FJW34_00130 [Acidobacteria bacterium]|nr:hypothetical protein [Acidobacteriota bacterium]
MRITRELRELYEDFHDHRKFAEESLSVQNKQGQILSFSFAPAPEKLRQAVEELRRKRKPIRIVYLKARQVFVSTATAAHFFHEIPFQAGQKGLVVAHELDAATEIFGYYKLFQDTYRPFRGLVGLPRLKQDNRGILRWANKSYIKVATANNVRKGRAHSLRYLHLSEYGFWRDARTLMAALMNSVPDDLDTMVVVESTANGIGNEFYQLWQRASDPHGDGEWTAIFCAWWEHPEYRRELDVPADQFQRSLSDEEYELAERYGLSLEQLAWRRWAIRVKCDNNPDTFKQEYPSCPEEAFLFSGRPRFSHQHLARMPVIRDAPTGDLEEVEIGPKKHIQFVQRERGPVVLYKRPGQHRQYVIGIDVCEGIDAAGRGAIGASDPDFSVATVLDRDTGEQVCKLRGRIEPAALGRYVAVLGRWYNWAFLVPEANGPGLALLTELQHEAYPPALIYHRQPDPDDLYAPEATSTRLRLGWKTTTVTRLQLVSTLDGAIRELAVVIRDPNTIAECRTFVVHPDGKPAAQSGCHDDEVIALGLGVIGLQQAPPDMRLLGLKPKPPPHLGTGGAAKYGQRRQSGSSARGTRLRL